MILQNLTNITFLQYSLIYFFKPHYSLRIQITVRVSDHVFKLGDVPRMAYFNFTLFQPRKKYNFTVVIFVTFNSNKII